MSTFKTDYLYQSYIVHSQKKNSPYKNNHSGRSLSQSSSKSLKRAKSYQEQNMWSRLIERTSQNGFTEQKGKRTRFEYSTGKCQIEIEQRRPKKLNNKKNTSHFNLCQFFQDGPQEPKFKLKPASQLREQLQVNIIQNKTAEQYYSNVVINKGLKERNISSNQANYTNLERVPTQQSIYNQEFKEFENKENSEAWKKRKINKPLPQSQMYQQFLSYKRQYDWAFYNQKYY